MKKFVSICLLFSILFALSGCTNNQLKEVSDCDKLSVQSEQEDCYSMIAQSKTDFTICNKITDEGMKYVARIQTLKYLSLAACSHITDAGLANLANSSSIETVDLRGCTAISDRGLSHLAIMPKLKEVSLGGCTNVSETGIEMLRKAFPNGKIEKDDQEWAMHTK